MTQVILFTCLFIYLFMKCREGGRERESVCVRETGVRERHRERVFASSWRKEGGREGERQREESVCARKE
jgi:hypothetical protein